MKNLLFLIFVFSSIFSLAQNNTPIGTWRMHLPYNSVRQIVETEKLLYVLAERGIYSYHLKSGEIELLTKVEGFSETEVSKICYSKELNVLVIGYENTNVDLLKGKTIVNLSGIKRSNIVGQKSILDIKIYNERAYLATSFGVVVIDLEKEEIIDDYQNLGLGGAKLAVSTLAIYNDSLFLGTAEGIKAAPAYNDLINLKNFESWNDFGSFDSTYLMENHDGSLFFVSDSILFKYSTGQPSVFQNGVKYGYRSLNSNHNNLVICKREGIDLVGENNTVIAKGDPFMDYAIIDFQDNIWFGGFYTGLIKKNTSNQLSYLQPQGPFGINAFEMEGDGTKMWVSSGGHSSAFSPAYNGYGYYSYEDGRWKNRDLKDPKAGLVLDFTAIEINSKSNEIWLSSFGFGVLQIKNGVVTELFDNTNSVLQLAPGDVVACLGLALDSKENLWIANYETSRALVVRKKDGTWADFNVGVNRVGEMVVDDFDNIWTTVPRSSGEGIVVAKQEDGEIIETRILKKGKNFGNVPNNEVNALAVDKDGEIWVGTAAGLAVFYNPSLVFEGGLNADAQQIIIDDGNDIGYLLGTEVINDIKIDGANRKWIATNNGAWLVKEDGSEVVEHLTVKNSPLPCNEVNTIGIVPRTGEVFFGTNCGIASFRGNATEATDLHNNTLVFPNPVHTGYEGPITITGVPEDATVKILDVAGRVVYEMVATGGTAVWDGYNFNGEKPQTGVYLIFTANKDDEETMVSKLLYVR